jgi:hypothetical protein
VPSQNPIGVPALADGGRVAEHAGTIALNHLCSLPTWGIVT